MAKTRIGGSETRFVSGAGIAFVCILIALLLLFILPRNDPRIAGLRQTVFDATAPVIELIGAPFRAMGQADGYFQSRELLQSERDALRQENTELRLRLNELTRSEVLMRKYRDLLNLPEEPGVELISARVIADLNSPFVHTLVTNGGRNAGIEAGQAVLGLNGLIGRVISSGSNSSRILLVTDFNSHIPVVALSSNVQAILSGTNENKPKLQFLPRGASLKDGDLLVTSGRGGQMPLGLPVGVVNFTDGDLSVDLLDDLNQLIFVRAVKMPAVEDPPAAQRPVNERAKP